MRRHARLPVLAVGLHGVEKAVEHKTEHHTCRRRETGPGRGNCQIRGLRHLAGLAPKKRARALTCCAFVGWRDTGSRTHRRLERRLRLDENEHAHEEEAPEKLHKLPFLDDIVKIMRTEGEEEEGDGEREMLKKVRKMHIRQRRHGMEREGLARAPALRCCRTSTSSLRSRIDTGQLQRLQTQC